MTLKDEIICYGIATASSDEMMGERGQAVRTERVFMLPGTYPKMPKKEESGAEEEKPGFQAKGKAKRAKKRIKKKFNAELCNFHISMNIISGS
jgi:prophage tail gpP-like protein